MVYAAVVIGAVRINNRLFSLLSVSSGKHLRSPFPVFISGLHEKTMANEWFLQLI